MDIILQVGRHSYKTITADTLREIAPKAFKKAKSDLEPEDLETIWVMTAKPEMESEDADGDQEWSETNEPELAADIAERWDQLAITVDGRQLVIFCGSLDDEYGNFWNNDDGEWENYAY